jgi:hypothetical protein
MVQSPHDPMLVEHLHMIEDAARAASGVADEMACGLIAVTHRAAA